VVAIPPSGISSMPPYTSPAVQTAISGSSSMTNCIGFGRSTICCIYFLAREVIIEESVFVGPVKVLYLLPALREPIPAVVPPATVKSSKDSDSFAFHGSYEHHAPCRYREDVATSHGTPGNTSSWYFSGLVRLSGHTTCWNSSIRFLLVRYRSVCSCPASR